MKRESVASSVVSDRALSRGKIKALAARIVARDKYLRRRDASRRRSNLGERRNEIILPPIPRKPIYARENRRFLLYEAGTAGFDI